MHEMFELLLIVDLRSQLIYCSEPFDVFILTIPSNSRVLQYLNLESKSGYCIMFEIVRSTQHPKVVKGQSAKVSAEMAVITMARLATNLKGTAAIMVAAEVTSVATAWVRAAP